MDARKLMAFEKRSYRRILEVCRKDGVTNNSIRDRVERHYTIVDLIKQRKLKLFQYICKIKDQRLVKTV